MQGGVNTKGGKSINVSSALIVCCIFEEVSHCQKRINVKNEQHPPLPPRYPSQPTTLLKVSDKGIWKSTSNQFHQIGFIKPQVSGRSGNHNAGIVVLILNVVAK